MTEQWSDHSLVDKTQRGNKAAFNLLVRKYQQKVTKLVAGYLNNQNDVADVTQEVFIKAYRALPNFRNDSAFYTWLYRIAVNTAKNHVVTQARRPPAYDLDASEAENYEEAAALKDNQSPERLLLSDEIKRVILETIDGLPEDLRSAFTLREMEGMSYDEIAKIMDCPVGTVRSRIFRARDMVDQRIKPLINR